MFTSFKKRRTKQKAEDCPCTKIVNITSEDTAEKECLWPSLRIDVHDVESKGEYRTVVMGQLRLYVTRTREVSELLQEWLEEDRS